MPKLIHAIFVKDEEHCIQRMLDSVLPYVSESYIMIDDRTTDKTAEIAEKNGCHVKFFTFDNFAKTKNTMFKWVSGKSDWIIGIAPDEIIEPKFGEDMIKAMNDVHSIEVDGVYFCRRHWEDLEMTKEYTKQKWYPDWQCRLIRNDYPRIHMVNYVHETVAGMRRTARLRNDIHHFNVYWKPKLNYDWEKMNTLYRTLQERQKKDGGKDIWP